MRGWNHVIRGPIMVGWANFFIPAKRKASACFTRPETSHSGEPSADTPEPTLLALASYIFQPPWRKSPAKSLLLITRQREHRSTGRAIIHNDVIHFPVGPERLRCASSLTTFLFLSSFILSTIFVFVSCVGSSFVCDALLAHEPSAFSIYLVVLSPRFTYQTITINRIIMLILNLSWVTKKPMQYLFFPSLISPFVFVHQSKVRISTCIQKCFSVRYIMKTPYDFFSNEIRLSEKSSCNIHASRNESFEYFQNEALDSIPVLPNNYQIFQIFKSKVCIN